jgi:cell shape-determining protein MreC
VWEITKLFVKLTRAGTRAGSNQSLLTANGGKMAALFLVLAVVDAVLLGDVVLANTSASSVTVFDHSLTGFTQGQLLVVAAGLGLLFALLLGLASSSSGARRRKRRQLRVAQRDLGRRVAELERENATLRQELERTPRVDTHA